MNGSANGAYSVRTVITTLGFLAIAAFFLQTEHRAHLFGALPFLFLLACPLLHLFMHGGHGGHGGHGDHDRTDDTRSDRHSGQGGGLP